MRGRRGDACQAGVMNEQSATPRTSSPVDDLEQGFDEASRRYDLMVALNPGYRRHLRAAADAVAASLTDPVPTLLDLGCGSGLSTRALLDACFKHGQTPRIIGVDASSGMLERAQAKRWPAGVTFVHGRGEALGQLGLPDADGALACYLLRNVPDLDATLTGIRAALRPGATFVAQEYSVVDDPAAQRRWQAVSRRIIEPLARTLTGDDALYRYLHASVDDFMSIDELAQRLIAAGFTDVESRTVTGWQRGILHLIRGRA